MKLNKLLALFFALLLTLCNGLTTCTNEEQPDTDASSDVFENAATDVTDALAADAAEESSSSESEAAIALTIDVVDADGNTETFNINTSADNLGDALLEANLVEGDNGEYGLYIKFVNGIRADYDLDNAYWALYSNGEMLMSGASSTPIADGEHYELVYTAG